MGDAGYPKQLDKGFSGIPNNVDAAFVWPVNDKIYFFKGSIYWKFDPDKSHQWTPPTQDPSPTGTEYQRNLTPPCNTVTGSLISSRMVVTIVSTTKTLC